MQGLASALLTSVGFTHSPLMLGVQPIMLTASIMTGNRQPVVRSFVSFKNVIHLQSLSECDRYASA